MSVEITGGGAIAVDPDEMRAVADRMAATAARLSAAADDLRRAHHTLSSTWSAGGRVDAGGLWATAQHTAEDADELAGDARGTAIMADAFELADLRSEQQLLAVERPVEAGLLQGRIDELVDSYPELDAMATQLTAGWERSSVEGLMDAPVDRAMGFLLDTSLGVPMWLLAPLLQRITARAGTLLNGTRLSGTAPPVAVRPVSTTAVDRVATTLSQLIQRVPGGAAQVAVEKRTHADGTSSFVAYIDGTRTVTSGGEEPWDAGSNWDLYIDREQSAAYAATMESLRQAGAEPGSRVDLVGYSQGGAIAAAVATSGVYATSRVMTVGSPTVPVLSADQTLIRVVHPDDPVGAGLTSGAPAASIGSPDSMTISRDDASSGEVSTFGAHFRDAYDETLALADESGDVRVERMRETLRSEADDIVSVERTEFQATRP
ncbi:hypothetical protein PQI51_13090 [Microbacterium esteraromaticum]|uniref:hypothetical protein n=1 Tax=Microbacterium esteraromaticum TaxID=57043 RepID=UPI0030B5B26C